ncbi:multicopper oxidase domain-containing protein [Flavobacterium humi]|uniref:Copper oxidase n=1 Tax=Flavobacterium humi TaxID=2562683 RepID=A0A4Z0L9L6_9FLAO|nr:multicopper oxidase domain-containing protein [Flavobacterium humi]TGD57880.1 copper oxidase [Flavobacterium humi]
MKRYRNIWVFSFLLASTLLFSQKEQLIIGRTTGKLAIKNNLEIRTFGFTNSLSGQVALPGSAIDLKEGDSLAIDFWNISQGNPVSLYCKGIDFQQRNKEKEIMAKNEPVHHMEHGFYSFWAKKAGTYLYYSPENYPFNLQAGMFGTIIIRAKEEDTLVVRPSNEALWCSYEIDTQWHTDTLMGTEYDSENKPVAFPKYQPGYFLINGKMALKTKGLQSFAHKKEKILLRLVNAGLYLHEVDFPPGATVQLIHTKDSRAIGSDKGYTVALHPGECLEMLLFLDKTTEKDRIVYHFIDPVSKKEHHRAAIPVLY